MTYHEGDKVTIYNLGPMYENKEYRAVIKGLSINHPIKIWIIEMVDKIDPCNYTYSHCTFPEAYIKFGWSECE